MADVRKKFYIVLTMIAFIALPAKAQKDGHWKILRKYVQKNIQVISSSENLIILAHSDKKDTIRVGLPPCDTCDIVGSIEHKRGDNPYRVWTAHEMFWSNKKRPQSSWGKYFRSSFLRILRPPIKEESTSTSSQEG